MEVAEQLAMAAIPLPMMGRTGLLIELVAPTVAGATRLVRTPPTQAEVVAAVTGRSQPALSWRRLRNRRDPRHR